jgi:nucleoside-diphosphate-sugar epimerase
MPPLFLTGASGFIGRRLLGRLARAGHPDVRLLTRDPTRLASAAGLPPTWRVLAGELANPSPWSDALRGCDTVVHLAAATGKATRRTHWEVNREGTRMLLEQAQAAAVRRFLFVSSIAVVYCDRPHYHYAEAKAAAETLVAASGLDYLIVRPTLVLGPGSPILESLRRLALLPIPLIFGDGRAAVQPVHVDDLALFLEAALGLAAWGGHAVTAGGPEILSIQELLLRMRATRKPDRRGVVHVPLRPTRLLLSLLEPVLFPLLPFTAGQLAMFANPSVAEADPFLAKLPTLTLGLPEMLGVRKPA